MADAPRFRFYWGRTEGCSILVMPREDWNRLAVRLDDPVAVDVERTPLAGVASDAAVVGAMALQLGSAAAQVSIFRYDPKDRKPYNRDDYDVWTDLAGHPRFQAMIASSTTDNGNFRAFCRENVLFVKRQPGPDHWLTEAELPKSMMLVVKST